MAFENRFGYSHSAYGAFKKCRRRFYLSKVQSWQGWPSGSRADVPEARLAYRLNKMNSLHGMAGSVVHQIAEMILRGELKTPEEAKAEGRRRFRDALIAGKDIAAASIRDPKRFPPLHEYYYGHPPEKPLQGEILGRLDACCSNVFKSSIYSMTVRKDVRMPTLEQFDSIVVGGHVVFCRPDAVALIPDGDREVCMIVDWKTGRRKEHHAEQAMTYALYAREKLGPEREAAFEIVIEYLMDGTSLVLTPTDEEVEQTKETIVKRCEEMTEFYPDRRINAADRQDFPMTENRNSCFYCEFPEMCFGTRDLTDLK